VKAWRVAERGLANSLNPFFVERRRLMTKLSPDECHERLKPYVVSWGSSDAWFGTRRRERPVYGSVSTRGFSLMKRHSYRNSFKTQAVGRFESAAGGTHITLRLSMHPFIMVFLIIGCVFCALFLGVLVQQWLSEPISLDARWLISLIVPAGWVALPIFGRWMARDEASFLIQFLAETLVAHELPAERGWVGNQT
jgi:hypothetical protein